MVEQVKIRYEDSRPKFTVVTEVEASTARFAYSLCEEVAVLHAARVDKAVKEQEGTPSEPRGE